MAKKAKTKTEPQGLLFLGEDPRDCVKYYNDAQLKEHLLTSAQILSTVHHELGCSDEYAARICTPTHTGHPLVAWVREATGNYKWVLMLFLKGQVEYKKRKKKAHFTAVMSPYLYNIPADIPEAGTTSPPLVLPNGVVQPKSSIKQYRDYCRKHRQATDVWTGRPVPSWYN